MPSVRAGSRARNNCMVRNSRSIIWWTLTPAGNWFASSIAAAAIVKHTNPAGCAEQPSLADAWRLALECDPVSAFGGVIGFNREVDDETAAEVAKNFLEAIAAPSFSEARARNSTGEEKPAAGSRGARRRRACRQKHLGRLCSSDGRQRGFQSRGHSGQRPAREPTAQEWAALEFGWKVVKHVKSNAIVYAGRVRPWQWGPAR